MSSCHRHIDAFLDISEDTSNSTPMSHDNIFSHDEPSLGNSLDQLSANEYITKTIERAIDAQFSKFEERLLQGTQRENVNSYILPEHAVKSNEVRRCIDKHGNTNALPLKVNTVSTLELLKVDTVSTFKSLKVYTVSNFKSFKVDTVSLDTVSLDTVTVDTVSQNMHYLPSKDTVSTQRYSLRYSPKRYSIYLYILYR